MSLLAMAPILLCPLPLPGYSSPARQTKGTDYQASHQEHQLGSHAVDVTEGKCGRTRLHVLLCPGLNGQEWNLGSDLGLETFPKTGE